MTTTPASMVTSDPPWNLLHLFKADLVVLKGAVIGIDDEDDSTFTITVDQSRSYYFQGEYN